MKNIIRLFLFILFSVISSNVYAQDGTGSLPKGGLGPPSGPLSMDGWHLKSQPIVANDKHEVGKIIYAITIDSAGKLLSVKVIEQTISDELAKICEIELRKMFFIRNRYNTSTSPTFSGKITFVFKVN